MRALDRLGEHAGIADVVDGGAAYAEVRRSDLERGVDVDRNPDRGVVGAEQAVDVVERLGAVDHDRDRGALAIVVRDELLER